MSDIQLTSENTTSDIFTNTQPIVTQQLIGFPLVEYSALREEIVKRIEIRFQLLALDLVATGTFLQFGSPTTILSYPILAWFLAAAWAHNDLRIRQVSKYIRSEIEIPFAGAHAGWEYYRKSLPRGIVKSLSLVSGQGVFLGTQTTALLFVLLRSNFPIEDIILLGVDIIIVILTFILLQRRDLSA